MAESQEEEEEARWPWTIRIRQGAAAGPMAWLLLGLLLLSQVATATHATTYTVGGFYFWGHPPSGFSFQTWADNITWYSDDALFFYYNYAYHNVWQFEDRASFEACDFSGRNLLGGDFYSTTKLKPQAPSSHITVYVGSSRGVDCLVGMSFALTYYTCSHCSPSSSSPPPERSIDDPSPPPPHDQSPPPPGSSSWSLPARSTPSPPYTYSDDSGGSGASLTGNSGKKWKTKKTTTTKTKTKKKKKKKGAPVAAIAVPVPIMIVLMLGVAVLVFYGVRRARRRRLADKAVPPQSPDEEPGGAAAAAAGDDNESGAYLGYRASSVESFPNSKPGQGMHMDATTRTFTYQELCAATHDFSRDSQIGKGGLGVVYKGVMEDGTAVAIKGARHLHKAEDKRQLLDEVAELSRLNHRNLVRLLGCCIEGRTGGDGDGEEEEVLMLVYELVPNGTVAEHLARSRQGFPTNLDWATRFKIAVETAEALEYLHVQVTPPIFHRDVKTANILLDHALDAKLADFGMSSRPLEVEGAATTGYLDPEYADKSDVYSLGMVLLELLAARKPVDPSKSPGEENLASVGVPLIVGDRVLEIVDPHMSTEITSREVLEAVQGVAQVAVACLGQDGQSRPSISEVVEMLQKIKSSNLRAQS